MSKDTKSALTDYRNSASPAVVKGLKDLKRILAKNSLQYDDFDTLYEVAIHICEFVGAKERESLREKLNLSEDA